MARSRKKKNLFTNLAVELATRALALGYCFWVIYTFIFVFDDFTGFQSVQLLDMFMLWGVPLLILSIFWLFILRWNNARKRRWLLQQQDWMALTHSEFEHFVAAIFHSRGYKTRVVGKSGGAGVDIELLKNKKLSAIVQVKHYNPVNDITPAQVREFLGAIDLRDAPGGYFVTSGDFTPAAWEYDEYKRLKLIDGQRLAQWQKEQQVS